MVSKISSVFRWIAVLPASITGMFIGYALSLLNGGMVRFVNGDIPNVISITDIMMFIIANAISGCAFIYAGTYVAPNYKKATTIVLAVLYTVFGTISGILELGMTGIGKTFFGIIISIIAAVISCIVICSKDNEKMEGRK